MNCLAMFRKTRPCVTHVNGQRARKDMSMVNTKLNIAREVITLKQMTVKELRGRYAEVFGETTQTGNKDWLWKRIAWRMQANSEGDLSERARRRAEELASDVDLHLHRPSDSPSPHTQKTKIRFDGRSGLPMAGTILTRQYKGETIQVTVRDNGFEYLGVVYKSLSAVAKVITGSHWNGNYFFGLGAGRKSHE